jgi:hypothetical protein
VRRSIRIVCWAGIALVMWCRIVEADELVARLGCWSDYPTQFQTFDSGYGARVIDGQQDGYCETVLVGLQVGRPHRVDFDFYIDEQGPPPMEITTILGGQVLGTESPSPGWHQVSYHFTPVAPNPTLRHQMHNQGLLWHFHCIAGSVTLFALGESSPFTILSATFDKTVYQNGHPTDPLTVTTKSNWGSGSASLVASLVTTGGFRYSLGTDVFSLSPGGQHQSSFPFNLPASNAPWNFSSEVTLTQSGVTVGTFSGPAFTGTPLSQAEIDEQVERLNGCALLEPGGGLALKLSAVATHGEIALLAAPVGSGVAGSLSSGFSILENGCRVNAYNAAGDKCRASAASTLVAIGAVALSIGATAVIFASMGTALPVVAMLAGGAATGWGLATAYVGDQNIINWCCEQDPPCFLAGKSAVIGEGEKVRGLMASIAEAGDSVGMGFSMHLGIEGPAVPKVSMPIGWVSSDSSSVDDVGAQVFAPDTLRWLTIGPRSSRLAAGLDTTVAPSDSLWPKVVALRASKPGKVFVGMAYRPVGSANTVRLFYPTVTVRSSSRMSVTIEGHPGVFPLEIDWTGDGQVDSLVYPEGTSDVKVDASLPTGPALSLESAPNPMGGSASFVLRSAASVKGVSVSIYDVAGREVRRLVAGDIAAGVHQVVWDGRADDGRPVASGMYHCVATHAGGSSRTMRLVVLR